jgi:hypothetical protein
MLKSSNRSCRFWDPNRKTVELGFESQPRKTCSLSPCAWYRLHMASPDLLIVRPWSTRPMLDHPQSSAPGLLLLPRFSLLSACHTCHLHITRQANMILHMNKNKKRRTTEMSQIRIQGSTCQWLITIKLWYWPIGFSISSLMSPMTTKSTKFESRIQDPTKHS